jgi:hypothetical protein
MRRQMPSDSEMSNLVEVFSFTLILRRGLRQMLRGSWSAGATQLIISLPNGRPKERSEMGHGSGSHMLVKTSFGVYLVEECNLCLSCWFISIRIFMINGLNCKSFSYTILYKMTDPKEWIWISFSQQENNPAATGNWNYWMIINGHFSRGGYILVGRGGYILVGRCVYIFVGVETF